ncbi:hypothetical protein [Shouchella clausii]|uniref:hypothetical protein n=1 Tax=Shouchella clausii TaxID=79880 RepID=UPI001C73B3A0|nr:hypothetical protein [Shouchella clausii]MBX0320193.1 hypothetical protein [Shouchella clausii]MEB5480792.1 hypothetical protein [Shouchella clausii]
MKQKEVYLTRKNNSAFLKDKKDKLFNCLCMFENNNPTAHKNIHQICREMEGRAKRFPFFADHLKYQHVLDTLENLYDYFVVIDQENHPIVRADLLKSMQYLTQVESDMIEHMKDV